MSQLDTCEESQLKNRICFWIFLHTTSDKWPYGKQPTPPIEKLALLIEAGTGWLGTTSPERFTFSSVNKTGSMPNYIHNYIH